MAPAHSYHLVWALLVFARVADYLVRMPLLVMESGVADLGRAGVASSVLGPAAVLAAGAARRTILAAAYIGTSIAAGASALVIDGQASPALLATALFVVNLFGWSVWDRRSRSSARRRDVIGSCSTGLWLSAAVTPAGAAIVATART